MNLGCRGGASRFASRRGRGVRGGSRSPGVRAEAPPGRCTVRGGPCRRCRGRAPRRPHGWEGQNPFEVNEYVAPPNSRESSMDLIQGVVVRPLKQIHDERGYLMEMLRTDWPEFERFAQSYITIGYPGIVKGWHYHKKQTDHFVMARLVVTGGMGFIGSCLVRRRLATGKDEVVVVDKLTYAGNPNNLKEYKDDRNLTFVQGDVCDRKLMDRVTKSADALVHFAAETHVDRSILEAGDFVRTDVMGTWSVLEAK